MSIQNSINAPTPFAINKGGTGNTAALTNGQLWIGDTGNSPAISTLTAGSGITITNGAGTITIAAPASDPSATVLPNPTTAVALQGNGNTTYMTTNTSGAVTTFTLPATPTVGEFYEIIGGGTIGWAVAQNASQQISVGGTTTTTGTGGSITSITASDSIIIYCKTSTAFIGIPILGQITIT